MAPGAHYGSGDSYHARYDLWVYIHVGHRPTAGINSHTHHRIRPVGRRSSRGWRRHQAWPCGRFPPSDSGMAGADEISHSDVLRNIDQYYCLSAVPYAPRQYWGVPAQSSHRYDRVAGLCVNRRHDVYSSPWILHSETAGQERTHVGGEASAWLLRIL